MRRKDVIAGLLLVVGICVVLVPFASELPDGLEKVAGDLGITARAGALPSIHAPFAEYKIPGIGNDSVSSVVSGILGAMAMFGMGWGLAALLKRRGK